MPRFHRPPSYRLQKARGCAVVTIEGKNHYLGRYGSPESREKYGRLIAEWSHRTALSPIRPLPTVDAADLSVNELILRYLDHAELYYRPTIGEPTVDRPARSTTSATRSSTRPQFMGNSTDRRPAA